jgi:2-oxoglutarate dehydrogenase complex dehydrogenase (E1) component-like enzyme
MRAGRRIPVRSVPHGGSFLPSMRRLSPAMCAGLSTVPDVRVARLAVSQCRPIPQPSVEKQAAVSRLIQIYSLRGHQIADLDPLGLEKRQMPVVMRLDQLGLGDADFDTAFYVGDFAGQTDVRMTLRELMRMLKRVYAGTVGADYAHLSRGRERRWIRERLERGMLERPLE